MQSDLSERAKMESEIKLQAAAKLTVIIDGDKKYNRRWLYKAVQDALLNHEISGFTMIKGVESFGSSRVVHSLRNEVTMSNLPLVFEAIDAEEKIRRAAAVIAEMLGAEGLVQIQPTRIMPPKRLTNTEVSKNAA